MTATIEAPGQVPPALAGPNSDRVPFGIDATGTWLELRFSGIENPHILVAGGSQTGKTSFQVAVATVAASLGCIVLVLDPKLRFARAFRHSVTKKPLPNVLVYRDADPKVFAREVQGVLELVQAEFQLRYRADEDADRDILGDRGRFPTVLLVADELGNLLDFAENEWPDRKPDGYKGDEPTRQLIHSLARMGAEARVIGCFANQTASEKELPAGTRTRTLCGQRVWIGPVSEGTQWRMLAGEGKPVPDTPAGVKGAGAIIYGDGKPIRFQGAWIDWKDSPEVVHRLAARGVEKLRATGYLDASDRLILGGHVVPRPGQMAGHVTGPWLDLLEDVPSAPAAEMPESGPVAVWPNGEPVALPESPVDAADSTSVGMSAEPAETVQPMVISLAAAAEFLGISQSWFRKLRAANPIPGEVAKAKGNAPGWPEGNLREWALAHVQKSEK